MTFHIRGKSYCGRSAIEVVRALEQDEKDYGNRGDSIRQFLLWSLSRLSSSVPPRDLDLSDRLDDETLALGYLLLLDECGVGEILNSTDKTKE